MKLSGLMAWFSIAGVSGNKQTSIIVLPVQNPLSLSGQNLDKATMNNTKPHDNGTESTLRGCRGTVQALLFCEALREANISLEEKEMSLDLSSLKITFKNKSFPIIIPLKVIRACYRLQPEKVSMYNKLTSDIEKGAKFSNKKEEYYVQVIYFVIMNILPPSSEKYDAGQYFPYFRFEDSNASDDKEEVQLWKDENMDNFIEHHTLNIHDVVDLKETSIASFGETLTDGGNKPVHVFAYVSDTFPVGNVGDTLGPYITGE